MIWGVLAIAVVVILGAWSSRSRWSTRPVVKTDEAHILAAVRAMLAEGDKTLAIELYRDCTGKSLKESAEAVEAIARGGRPEAGKN